jgi:hypothetical protein
MSQSTEWCIGHLYVVQSGLMNLPGMSSTYFGVLEEVDEHAIYLRSPAGDVLFIPTDTIRGVNDMGPGAERHDDAYLRPSSNPAEDHLLRPQAGSEADTERLPRPSEEPHDDA